MTALTPATESEKSSTGYPPLTRFALLTAMWLAVSAAFAFQVSALGFAPWPVALSFALLDWGPWIIFSPVVLVLGRKIPIGPQTWRWALPVHLVLCAVVIVLIEVSMSALSLRRDLLMPPPGPPMEQRERMDGDTDAPPPPKMRFGGPRRGPPPWFRLMDRARFAVPVYWMLIAAAHAMAQQKRSAERERRALRAEALAAEARLMALQAQLNPHFLFNTLNTIAQLVYENAEAAEEMITCLSDLLRAVLAAQRRREVSLDEELELLERYFAIQKVRFADRLEVRYEIDPAAVNISVPTLLLQPLAENAIKHGIAPITAPGCITIRARVNSNELRIEISDTGVGKPADDAGSRLDFKEGVGLANTRARLQTLYPARHTFDLERAAEGGVLVRVILPVRKLP